MSLPFNSGVVPGQGQSSGQAGSQGANPFTQFFQNPQTGQWMSTAFDTFSSLLSNIQRQLANGGNPSQGNGMNPSQGSVNPMGVSPQGFMNMLQGFGGQAGQQLGKIGQQLGNGFPGMPTLPGPNGQVGPQMSRFSNSQGTSLLNGNQGQRIPNE